MTDADAPSQKDLLNAFQLGPSWARDGAPGPKLEQFKERGDEPWERKGGSRGRGDERGGGRGGERERGRGGAGGRGPDRRGQGDQRDQRGQRDQRDQRDQREREGRGGGGRFGGGHPECGGEVRPIETVPPPRGLRVEIHPSAEAVELIAREVHQFARVYSLYEIASVLLARRDRYRLKLIVEEGGPTLWACKRDDSVWLTRGEALAHMWESGWRSEFYEEETIEVEPPKGVFQHVARCGFSGELLGPPNYHGYQKALRDLHRERFSHIPFERYATRVRTEHGEEVVAEWLATMTTHKRIRELGNQNDNWMTDRGEVERHFLKHHLARAYEEKRVVEIPGDVTGRMLSPELLEAVKLASGHARKHPAMIIPTVCRLLELAHLPVFKRQGKLFAGPARPHPLARATVLAERPAAIIRWLEERRNPRLKDLWNDLLPDGQDEPCEKWLVDLLWLLRQGNVLLMADDSLWLPGGHARQSPAAKRAPSAGAETAAANAAAGAVPVASPPPAKDGRGLAKTKQIRRRRKRKRTPRPSIKVRRAVEKMSARRLKKVRGAERIWRNRLRMRVFRTVPAAEDEQG